MGKNENNLNEIVHLARLALAGRRQDVIMLLRRFAKKTQTTNPQLSLKINELLIESPTRNNPIRGSHTETVPVDNDSRLQLARVEYPDLPSIEPIWTDILRNNLEQVIIERNREQELLKSGLHPTKSLLFTGLPGVGKSLAANWLAAKLNRPLVILDLSAVMSSYLGRTGNNLRHVLDYAKSVECVLFLDEFDAIAKRRDDDGEIGELKRLVTVLLQEIDDFPETGLLIAATNHPDLLDPAVWRRFEMVLEFPLPNSEQIKKALKAYIGEDPDVERIADVLAICFQGTSYSEIQRAILQSKKESILRRIPLRESIKNIINQYKNNLTRQSKADLIRDLGSLGFGQREINALTGISRDTIRKYINEEA